MAFELPIRYTTFHNRINQSQRDVSDALTWWLFKRETRLRNHATAVDVAGRILIPAIIRAVARG